MAPTAVLEGTRESQNTQPLGLRFRALLTDGLPELELALV